MTRRKDRESYMDECGEKKRNRAEDAFAFSRRVLEASNQTPLFLVMKKGHDHADEYIPNETVIHI